MVMTEMGWETERKRGACELLNFKVGGGGALRRLSLE